MKFSPFITFERCIELIDEYKLSNHMLIFWQLLVKFDRLLIYTIRNMRKMYPHLQEEVLQELYHTAILALEMAILSRPENEEPNKLPARIMAYVKARVRAEFPDRSKEKCLTDINNKEVTISEHCVFLSHNQKTAQAKIDLDRLIHLAELTIDEELCLRLRYLVQFTEKETMQVTGLTYKKVRNRVQNALRKLQIAAEKDVAQFC